MTPTTRQKEIFLMLVKQRCVDLAIDDDQLSPENFETHLQYVLEAAYHALRISFKYPAQALQDNREVARYPVSRWGYFLHAIGLGKYAKWKRVVINEELAFPNIAIPPELTKIGSKICYDFHHVGLDEVYR